jgi:HAD superfamily hydrolase (TIGR01490 family)
MANADVERYQNCAFFDVDETIITFKSMFVFHEFMCEHSGLLGRLLGGARHRRFMREVHRHLSEGQPREFINRLYYQQFQGRRQSDVTALIEQFYRWLHGTGRRVYNENTLNIIRDHKNNGVAVVLVSGSFIELLQPIADFLGADRILATRMEVVRGVYTGEILPPQMIGAGKASSVRNFLSAEAAASATSWAYGDHHSDIGMLEQVDHPNIVSTDPELIALAVQRGWGVVSPNPVS